MNTTDAAVLVDVEARFFAAAKAAAGTATAVWRIVPGETVAEAVARNGFADDPVFRRSSFLRNGRACRPGDQLDAGDQLDVLPPFAGG